MMRAPVAQRPSLLVQLHRRARRAAWACIRPAGSIIEHRQAVTVHIGTAY